jgi:hypothetical protein
LGGDHALDDDWIAIGVDDRGDVAERGRLDIN